VQCRVINGAPLSFLMKKSDMINEFGLDVFAAFGRHLVWRTSVVCLASLFAVIHFLTRSSLTNFPSVGEPNS
jgi:hypothetical protein